MGQSDSKSEAEVKTFREVLRNASDESQAPVEIIRKEMESYFNGLELFSPFDAAIENVLKKLLIDAKSGAKSARYAFKFSGHQFYTHTKIPVHVATVSDIMFEIEKHEHWQPVLFLKVFRNWMGSELTRFCDTVKKKTNVTCFWKMKDDGFQLTFEWC